MSTKLRPTTFTGDFVLRVPAKTKCHVGFGVAVRPATLGGDRDVLLIARTTKELRVAFPLVAGAGSVLDERGVHRVAILPADAIALESDDEL